MESSDEEDRMVPDFVTNYYFVDHKGDPAPFSNLPLQRSDDTEIPNSSSTSMILRGTTVSGLEKIFEKVIGWRLELSCVVPEFYVLNKDKIWMNLLKPRKSFEVVIKSVLVTAHFLHFVKKNLETSEDAMWSYILKALSFLDVKPCKQDLLDQISLIEGAKMRDKDLANSKFLSAFLLGISGKSEAFDEEQSTTRMSEFITDDGDYDDGGDDDDEDDDDDDGNGNYNESDNAGDEDEDEDELFDYVCAFCDEGGEILGCEGKCIRSFHATVDAGVGSRCKSLGYTHAHVEALPTFLCKNCKYQQHQCFICGRLGSSNKSSGAEVFHCVSATCGHFYHPKCVANFIHPIDGTKAKELREKILAGESFICPAHKCAVCKHGEDKKINELQFALCRRCPKAYHRKCLPRNIIFQADQENHTRAWDGLLPSRVLIYCMKHSIIPELGTPLRNHIIFPTGDRTVKRPLDTASNKERDLDAKRTKFLGNATGKIGRNIQKPVEKTCVSVQTSNSIIVKGGTSKLLKNGTMFISDHTYKSSSLVKKDQSNTVESAKSYLNKSKLQNTDREKTNNMIITKSTMIKASNSLPPVDADMKNRILRLMETSTSSFDMKEFVRKQRMLSEYSYNQKPALDKNITQGRVEGAVKAVRTALKKLEEGCSIEDAKAVCEPQIVKKIVRWRKNIGTYIAPFLNGKRYTSFGRHFTKVEKLKQIVDRLQYYVEDGDVIVDFCCGSNDFSCLMKEKLEKMGKNCSYKNFDLITPKNDFNFEKRDWMKVGVEELPNGSNMIMGLNPPFANANEFVQKALKFEPKLIILIVPESTKRLDRLNPMYDLIWEDDHMLAGKSFYLPGSVNVHNEQLDQWNLKTPPLYLWSRPDWTAHHVDIALNHGHLLHSDPHQISGSNCFIRGNNNISMTTDDIHVYGDLMKDENIAM